MKWIALVLLGCSSNEPAATTSDAVTFEKDIVPLFNVPLSLRAERPPRKVYLAPEGTPIPFEHLVGRINLLVPEVRGHAMVVFE